MQPEVVYLCLHADRPQFAARLLRSFRHQTYPANLVIYDTGNVPLDVELKQNELLIRSPGSSGRSIGTLRNEAVELARNADIIVHADVDDWSGPDRIQQQVDALCGADLDAVGYNEMLFWREEEGEAWLYSNPNPHYALGTSLCYWRETHEHNKFSETAGEESEYNHWFGALEIGSGPANGNMIACIHEGNGHRLPYRREVMMASEVQGGEWKRVPEWDEHCRARMAL